MRSSSDRIRSSRLSKLKVEFKTEEEQQARKNIVVRFKSSKRVVKQANSYIKPLVERFDSENVVEIDQSEITENSANVYETASKIFS